MERPQGSAQTKRGSRLLGQIALALSVLGMLSRCGDGSSPPELDVLAPEVPVAGGQGEGDRASAAARVISRIESRREFSAQDGPAEYQEFKDLTEQLRALGDAGRSEAVSYLVANFADSWVRAFWLPFSLEAGGIPHEILPLLNQGELTTDEWGCISYYLYMHEEKWALDLALQLSDSEDTGIRRNAVRALLGWSAPRARTAVRERMLKDSDPSVRASAARVGCMPGFAGTEEDLLLFQTALEDADGAARGAVDSLEAVVDPASAPDMRLSAEEAYESDPWEVIRTRWAQWLRANLGRLVWSTDRRRFVIRTPR